MLTADLLRASTRGRDIKPSYLDPTKPASVEAAADLLVIWQHAVSGRWRRSDLDQALNDVIGPRRDHKVLRGLAKLLLDRTTFDVQSPLPPKELRAKVFAAARQRGPLALEPGPLGRPTATDVYRDVASELGVEPDRVAEGLYADLEQEQRLVAFKEVPEPTWLLHRYNVALVQAVLFRATHLTLRALDPSGPRVRQLFRSAHFHGLLFLARRDGPWWSWTLDGPESLLTQSTRYGLELASFFPSILLLDVPWEVEAEIRWRPQEPAKRLFVDHQQGLQGFSRDIGAWRSREQAYFAERWSEFGSPWELGDGDVPIDLGGLGLIVPTFTLRHPDGRTAFLDVLGYWRPDALDHRLKLIARYGPGTVLTAISRKRKVGDGTLDTHGVPFIEFADVLSPSKVATLLETQPQK
jgi:hypothetical protein